MGIVCIALLPESPRDAFTEVENAAPAAPAAVPFLAQGEPEQDSVR